MKFFSHDTDARQNRKLWRLIKIHGMTGYGIWWALLEAIYQAESDGFQIRADELWLEKFADELRLTDERVLIRVFDTLAEVGLINSQLWHEHTLHVESAIERGDSYVQKKAASAERKRREREKRQAESQPVTEESRVTSTVSHDVTPSEAEAYSKSESKSYFLDPDRAEEKKVSDASLEEPDRSPTSPVESPSQDDRAATPEPLTGAKDSAAAPPNSPQRENPTADYDQRLRDLAAGKFPRWKTGPGPNDWDEPIVQGIMRQFSAMNPQKPPCTRASAIAYISARARPEHDDHPALLARVEEAIASIETRKTQSDRASPQNPVSMNDLDFDRESSLAALRLAKAQHTAANSR